MKPFNLEKALAGEPVVNGRGVKVTEIVYFNTVDQRLSPPVIAILDGVSRGFTIDGIHYEGHPNESIDLFMDENELWVNVYYSKAQDHVWVSIHYISEQEAKQNIITTSSYQTTIKINP